MLRQTLAALAEVLLLPPGFVSSSLESQAVERNRPEDFPNILWMTGAPARADDWPAARFSDFGAWFAYTLPPGEDRALRGSFPGPFLVNERAWAALTLARLELEDDSGRPVEPDATGRFEATAFPGRLHQSYTAGGYGVALDLVFVSGRSAIVRATVTNAGRQARRVGIGWGGELIGGGRVTASASDIVVETPRGGRIAVVPMTPGAARPLALPGGDGFRIRPAETLVLAPGESAVNYLGHVVSTAGEDDAVARAGLEALARAPARAFMAGAQRWSDYVARAVRLSPAYSGTPGYRVAAVKALVTLLGNWRRPLGGLRHDALAASSSATGASVFRAGDAWKHSAALARIYPELAVSQVRAMFDAQDAEGMVPGAVGSDPTEADGLASAPPLSAWAVWEVFRQTGDRSFVHDMQPRLQRYHEWWGRRRDRDQDGLCEWGASVDRVEAAKGESGMEGARRFDKASLRTRDDRSWTLDLESVDLNAWLLAEKRYLAQISKELLRGDSSLGPAAAKLEAGIRAWMFDVKTGCFRDAAADGRGLVGAPGPEGWIALWAGAATTGQAALARQALVDPRRFATPIPFPSLAADDPAFDAASRWRGGVRPDLAFFAVTGLRRYRFNEDARRLAGQLLDGAKGLTTPGPPIREAYHALTGEGLGAPDSGPTAAALLLMLLGG